VSKGIYNNSLANKWTKDEEAILKENYHLGVKDCLELLPHRSHASLYGKANKLGLKSEYHPSTKWTHEDYENKLFELEINHWPIEKYNGYDTPILHSCIKNHETLRAPSNVLKQTDCTICLGLGKRTNDLYLKDLLDKDISYLPIEQYVTTDIAILHKCKKGHEWKSAPKHILSGRECPQCSPQMGFYSNTFFTNHPETGKIPGILYVIVLVSKSTQERCCVKIGITKGSSNKDVLKRAAHFKGYEPRIQKLVYGKLEDVYYLEQYLHELWIDYKYKSEWKFGGAQELFEISMLPQILKSIPDKV
jgi:hypothetical protein